MEFEKEEAMLEREGLLEVMAEEIKEEERISEEERMIEEMMKQEEMELDEARKEEYKAEGLIVNSPERVNLEREIAKEELKLITEQLGLR